MSTSTAPVNFYMHRYDELDQRHLFLNGWCVTTNVQGSDRVINIIGPFPTEDDAGLLALQMAREAPERDFHLWPMVGLVEMKEPPYEQRSSSLQRRAA